VKWLGVEELLYLLMRLDLFCVSFSGCHVQHASRTHCQQNLAGETIWPQVEIPFKLVTKDNVVSVFPLL
jgi:hypothetical protein